MINPTNKTVSDETKQLIDKLLLELISWRGIARVTGVNWSWLQNYVNNKLAAVPRQIKVSDKQKPTKQFKLRPLNTLPTKDFPPVEGTPIFPKKMEKHGREPFGIFTNT